MAQETVIDTLVTRLLFKSDTRALSRLDARLEATKRRLRALSNVSIAVGAGLTAGLTKSTGVFKEYERQLALTEGLVGVTREQLDKWGPSLREIGKLTGIGPVKLAEAMYFVTSAGLRGADALDVLEMSATASAAGVGATKTVVDMLTSVVNAYGTANITAAEGVDALTMAVREGKLAPETLAGAFSRVLPVASTMGIKFQEVAGMMAAMSRTGTNAQEAATQLRSIMTQILKPQDDARKALEEVGMDIPAVRAQIDKGGLLSALRMIEDAFQGSDEQMTRVFGDIRGLVGIFDMLGKNAEISEKIIKSVMNSTGTTQEAFEVMAKTLEHITNVSLARFEGILVSIGPHLKTTAERAINFVNALFDWFEGLGAFGRKALASLLSYGPVLAIIGIALRALTFILSPLVKTMLVLARVTGLATIAQWAWNTATTAGTRIAALARTAATALGVQALFAAAGTKAWTFAQTLLNLAMKANPIVRIITWVVALTAAIIAFAADWEHVWGGAWEVVKKVFGWLSDMVSWLWEAGKSVWDWFGRLRESIRDLLPDWLKKFIGADNADTGTSTASQDQTASAGDTAASEDPINPPGSPPNLDESLGRLLPEPVNRLIETNTTNNNTPTTNEFNSTSPPNLEVPGLTEPLPAPTRPTTANTSTSNNHQVNVEVGGINIDAKGADSKELGENVSREISRQTKHAVDAADSRVAL